MKVVSWYQIGKGYYGVSTESGTSTKADRDETARVFRKVFSIPSSRIQIEPPKTRADRKSVRSKQSR